jgi:hypothetical protein
VQIECPFCLTRRCKECGDVGYIHLDRDIETASRLSEEILRSWVFLQNHKTLPEAGGMNDQPSTWVEAVAYLDAHESFASRQDMDDARSRGAAQSSPPPLAAKPSKAGTIKRGPKVRV